MAAMVQKMHAGKTLGTTQPPSNNRPPTSTLTPEDQAGTSTENRQGNEEPERGGILKLIHALRNSTQACQENEVGDECSTGIVRQVFKFRA